MENNLESNSGHEVINSVNNFNSWFERNVTILKSSENINANEAAIIELLLVDSDEIISLGFDCECDIPTVCGRVVGLPRKVSIMQLSHEWNDDTYVVMHPVHRLKKFFVKT